MMLTTSLAFWNCFYANYQRVWSLQVIHIFILKEFSVLKQVKHLIQLKYSGFVQSLEFLKKSWNLQTSFPDLEKVWKIKIKSGKYGEKSGVFCFENCNKRLIAKWNFFSGSQMLFHFDFSENIQSQTEKSQNSLTPALHELSYSKMC